MSTWPHRDPALFREAVAFTAARTGFTPRLIEKDYFCSLVLARLAGSPTPLVFKGGTCLAKVHAGFYRLSEDLDFSVPVPVGASRAGRSRKAQPVKAAVLELAGDDVGFGLARPMQGSNGSTQYNGALVYSSLIAATEGRLAIEVGLREPLLEPAVRGEARTLLLDPVRNAPAVAPFRLDCMAWRESMAEKLRAALTRRAALEAQRRARLQPVLRAPDFAVFDLDRAFGIVAGVATMLGR